MTRWYTTYNRTYLKIQDVLGIVSGFLSMFLYAISIIYNVYLSIIYKFFLYDSILDFRQKETKKAWGGSSRKESIAIDQIMQEDFDFYNLKNIEYNKDKSSNSINDGIPQIVNIKQNIHEGINNQNLLKTKNENFSGGIEIQYNNNDTDHKSNPHPEHKIEFDKS